MSILCQLVDHLKLPIAPESITQAQRLFHGRGYAYDDLHHVTIDWLSPVVLITLFAPEPLSDIEVLADKVLTLFPSCKSVMSYRGRLVSFVVSPSNN